MCGQGKKISRGRSKYIYVMLVGRIQMQDCRLVSKKKSGWILVRGTKKKTKKKKKKTKQEFKKCPR